ncbi:unnamed protein product (macronuclear) [Paramecium tetraurelia]|uniref:Uncharacterized protein n=1 Tax=Paramecium tetraurelia TaxID=5888 RepID=A0DP86_PARTE|nr:uncharacterized protein GSPATT00019035001 [Paramecium tetraurelia]CAK84853.1 unnamed protein product [Paramecium tetraurelia]|eukprot:XP_001452250.1 hypothetical protein (macronuclear) [Paramecium tetraurelia strain d4-2]
MIDLFSLRNRNSEVTDLSGNHSLTQKSVLHELSMPKINILVSSFEPKLENLIKADGDCIEINPETERVMKKTHQRRDMFQNEILKGKKQHRVTFRDQILGQSLKQIKYYTKEPQQDLDECCPCKIF